MAYKVFSNGDALTGSELNTYLMNQSVMVFASATARDAALTSPTEGMVVWLQDANKYVYYTGSAWADLITPASSGNAIINGAFDIWQRGTSSAAATTTRYLADRWETFGITSTVAASQQTFTPGTAPVAGYEGTFFYRTVVASGNTAGSGAVLDQKIEDVRRFAGETVTVSFWAKADATKSMSIELLQNFGSGGSATVNITPSKVALTTSWARYSYTVAVPSIAGKTIGTNSFFALYLWYDAGSDFNARTGSLGNQSGTFDIWGVQLEADSVATPFKRNAPSIQAELAACQRYLPTIQTPSGEFASGFAYSTTKALFPIVFPVTPRKQPTGITVSSAGHFTVRSATASQLTCTAISFSTGTLQGACIEATVASGLVAGNGTNIFDGGSGYIYFEGCEL
jgi:hypothetical protein